MGSKNHKNRKLQPKPKPSNRVSKNHPQKKKKDDIVINANQLNWKSVEIPDTLDDFGGFYGLEEIDGVGVKVTNGKLEFIARDSFAIKKNAEPDNEEPNESQMDTESDGLIEFKNMDEIPEGDLSALSSGDEDELETADYEEASEELGSDNDEDLDGKLQTNIFSAQVSIGNQEPPILPEWTDHMNLSYKILNGLAAMAFTRPTEIQLRSIPRALDGADIMGKASTGSGKTLAYGIPILEQLLKDPSDSRAIGLIFTPTRELAHQVTDHLQSIWSQIEANRSYNIISLTGGLSIQKQERILGYKNSARIVVATPGRFLELIEKNRALIERFADIDSLVLDEADRLLQDGHFEEFEKILKLLSKARRGNVLGKAKNSVVGWQTMVFSATFSLDLFNKLDSTNWKNLKKKKYENEMEQVLEYLMKKINFRSKPEIIDTNPEEQVASQIKESLIECLPTERDLFVYYFVMMFPGTTLVFCNSINSVKTLSAYLNNLEIPAFQIHSSMTQKNRLRNLEKFKQQSQHNNNIGKPTVLVASDVAARGLDIPGIQHVLHYHLPRSADVYIHRSGRTARGENEGVAVMICSPHEAMGPLRKLRKLLSTSATGDERKKKWQKDVELLPIEPDILTQLRERSKIASELAQDSLATRSLSKDENWLKKAADDLDIELDSDDEEKDIHLAKTKTKKMNKQLGKNDAKALRFHLKELLARPIRKDARKSYLTGGLVNLADSLVKKKGHESIIGLGKTDALQMLKKKNKDKK